MISQVQVYQRQRLRRRHDLGSGLGRLQGPVLRVRQVPPAQRHQPCPQELQRWVIPVQPGSQHVLHNLLATTNNLFATVHSDGLPMALRLLQMRTLKIFILQQSLQKVFTM